jgi:uncharacterized membrane protein
MQEHLQMAETQTTPQKKGRLWTVILVCSLALNLAVAGIVGGTLLSGRIGEGPPRSFDLGVGPVANALERDERRAIGRELRRNRVLRDLDPRGRAAEMLVVLQAEPFDREALRAIFAEQSNDLIRVQARAQDALLETIAAMTPERRAAFAAAVAEEMARGARR